MKTICVDANKYEHLLNCMAQLNFVPKSGQLTDEPIIKKAYYEAREMLHNSKTLANQVSDLAYRAIHLENLLGEVLATIKLNVERGYIAAINDEGKLNLTKVIESWYKQLNKI